MVAYIMDYTGDNITGSFSALSVVEHRKLDEYKTATITLMPEDYLKCKKILAINTMISYSQDPNTDLKRLFRVVSISATEKLVTIEADDYRNVYKYANIATDSAGVEHVWRLYDLIVALNKAIKNP